MSCNYFILTKSNNKNINDDELPVSVVIIPHEAIKIAKKTLDAVSNDLSNFRKLVLFRIVPDVEFTIV